MSAAKRFFLLTACALLAGCSALREPYERPAPGVPGAWRSAGPVDAWPDPRWWQVFGSSELDGLILAAQQDNRDVRAAYARVGQARAIARIQDAALWPNLGASADASRLKSAGLPGRSSYELSLAASYELDLWGRNRLGSEAAHAALLASRYGAEAVRIALVADVADAYFLVLSLNDRIRVAEDNLAVARRLLDLVEAQYRAGRVSGLELARQRSQVATAQTDLPPLRQQRQAAINALAVLLGRAPAEVAGSDASLLGVVLPAAGAGAPVLLLERRPDIRRAEADLVAAHADIGAARAALLPSLVLSGRGGVASATVGSLFDGGSGFATLAASLVGTIFDGGRLAGQLDLARARKQELVEIYLQAILIALQDVEDALAAAAELARQEQAQEAALAQAREAYRLAELRYREGAEDFSTVLDAQRTLLAAQSALTPIRLARFNALVALYRAQGGGWDGALPG